MADNGGSSSSCYGPCLDIPAVLKWVTVPTLRLKCGVLTGCSNSAPLVVDSFWAVLRQRDALYRCPEVGRMIIKKVSVKQMVLCAASPVPFFTLIDSRERGREGGREGEQHRCERETSVGCLPHVPWPGIDPHPRRVPWWGVKPRTFQSAGWCPLSHVARAVCSFEERLSHVPLPFGRNTICYSPLLPKTHEG